MTRYWPVQTAVALVLLSRAAGSMALALWFTGFMVLMAWGLLGYVNRGLR